MSDKRRYVIVWNSEEGPVASVIEVGPNSDHTRAVLNFLRDGWKWTPDQLIERSKAEEVHVFDVTEKTQRDPRIIGTAALFRNNGELDRVFTDLIPIYEGETVKQALIERAVPKLGDVITFKIPDELLGRTKDWRGIPLLTKVAGVDNIVTTIIGQVFFIDPSLAKALETFDLNSFWLSDTTNESIWSASIVQDFSAHIQTLCEEHSIDAPCSLE